MSTSLLVGQTYRVKPECWQPWMGAFSGVYPETTIVLRKIESDGIHRFDACDDKTICLEDSKVFWYDEKSAMREITPAREAEEVTPEWRLPAGTFFRVNGKHEPLYLVMSNSHVFNLTAKQMHTTCSSRFKDKQLSVANVQMSEVL